MEMGHTTFTVWLLTDNEDETNVLVAMTVFVGLCVQNDEVVAGSGYCPALSQNGGNRDHECDLPHGMLIFNNTANNHSYFDDQVTVVQTSQSHWQAISPLKRLEILDPVKLT